MSAPTAHDAAHEYEIILILDMGKELPPVQKLADELSAALSSCGADEKVKFSGRMRVGIFTAKRQMSEDELNQVKSITHAEFLTSNLPFAKSITSVELVHRKPGNAPQSVS